MSTIFLVLGIFLILLPIVLWVDSKSISNEEWNKIEEWHNFRKAFEKGKK